MVYMTWLSLYLFATSLAKANPAGTSTSSAVPEAGSQVAFTIPASIPTTASSVDPALLSVSIEFFTFPGYMSLTGTATCLANIQALRGSPPAIRIGGTTQDRATYDPALLNAVDYTVATPADAPNTLTYGPSFFTLANQLKGDVTVGLNRQLGNITNTCLAAVEAKSSVKNLLSIELGNEPEFYASGSPIIVQNGNKWSASVDGGSQKSWFTTLSSSVGNIFQGAVYLQYPTWSTTGLIPLLGSAISTVKTFSGHSYPQSACGGAATNLPNLMSHSGIVSYTRTYKTEATSAHSVSKRYFLGETNSATCGGGGISPTFGAGLWVMDYTLQGALNGVERMYFHQGTISNCAYCFWGNSSVFAPYYGAVFVSEFLGSEGGSSGTGTKLVELDNGASTFAAYAVFSTSTGKLLRVLLYNSVYFDGTGTRGTTSATISGLVTTSIALRVKRLTAPNATSLAGSVTIGGAGTFDTNCKAAGTQSFESVPVSGGSVSIGVKESEAVILYL